MINRGFIALVTNLPEDFQGLCKDFQPNDAILLHLFSKEKLKSLSSLPSISFQQALSNQTCSDFFNHLEMHHAIFTSNQTKISITN